MICLLNAADANFILSICKDLWPSELWWTVLLCEDQRGSKHPRRDLSRWEASSGTCVLDLHSTFASFFCLESAWEKACWIVHIGRF